MPILELQKRARELGRIRIGRVVSSGNGKRGRPEKLDHFRLTSHSEILIRKVAELYGGEAQRWTPQGSTVAQWEVETESSRIPIMVPPQPVTQWLETWSGGGCLHRCDGVTNALTGEPCDGGPAHDQARPTTRLNVVLRDVEGIGVWRLESHGWNAAVELPDVAAFLAQAGGYINGWLALEERTSKKEGEALKRFMVPIIEVDVTPAELMAGRGRIAPPSIEGPVVQKAIAAPPAVDYLAAARECGDLQGVRDVWALADRAGHLTPDLKDQLIEIGQRFSPQTPAAEVEHIDPDQEWQRVLAVAGQQGITLDDLLTDFTQRSGGVAPEDASGIEMRRYIEHLQAVKA